MGAIRTFLNTASAVTKSLNVDIRCPRRSGGGSLLFAIRNLTLMENVRIFMLIFVVAHPETWRNHQHTPVYRNEPADDFSVEPFKLKVFMEMIQFEFN